MPAALPTSLRAEAIRLYRDELLTTRGVAAKLNLDSCTVNRWVKKAGVMRSKSEANRLAWRYGRWDREATRQRAYAGGFNVIRRGRPCKWKGQELPESWRDAISEAQTGKRCGPDHPMWRGGPAGKYGPGWKRAKRLVRRRAGDLCESCGRDRQQAGESLHVHHIKPFRSFADKSQAHDLDNLILLCRRCHARWERQYLQR